MIKWFMERFKWSLILAGLGLLLLTVASSTSPAEAANGTRPLSQAVQIDSTNDYCLGCHNRADLTKTLPSGETLSLYVDPDLFDHGIHNQQNIACVDCHTGITAFPHPDFKAQNIRDVTLQMYGVCQKCHADSYEQTLNSVHQIALQAGNTNAAVCTDCHNPHQQTRLTDPQTGRLTDNARLEVSQTCARCHSAVYDTYKGSVHGAALTQFGNRDVPTCIDCHGVHNIQDSKGAAFHNAVPQLCAKCHTDPLVMNKYGISTQVLNTYVADFHGTTVELFAQSNSNLPTDKPVCTDCHGVHEIAKVDNPKTGLAIKQNLLAVCQRCHPDATANFPSAWMNHYIPSPQHYPVVYYVSLFYKIFIPAVIGGMLIFVLSDIVRRLIERRKGAAH